jgi:sporulation protein YabP
MAQEVIKLPHKLALNERKALTVTGVTEVVSFDEASVVLRTSMGTLVVDGTELQLKTLSQDGGQVAVEGKVSSMVYEETRATGGFLQRLFG